MAAAVARAWLPYLLGLVLRADDTAALCLDGDEWVIEVERTPPRMLMRLRVIQVDSRWRRR